MTTVDGVYGSPGFSVIGLDINKNKKIFEYKFQKKDHFEYPNILNMFQALVLSQFKRLILSIILI